MFPSAAESARFARVLAVTVTLVIVLVLLAVR
jgi:hypothetical protein